MDRPSVERALPKLKDWLTSRGAEILVPTNEWELLRFRAKGTIQVVYKKSKSNQLSYVGGAGEVVEAFFQNRPWSAGTAGARPKPGKYFKELLARDGSACFYCLRALGDDMTREHLVPVVFGGPNHLANMVLAHGHCNANAGHLSAFQKVRIREQYLLGVTKPIPRKPPKPEPKLEPLPWEEA